MFVYVLRRIISAFGVLLFDAILVFCLIHLTPGDPAVMIVGGESAYSMDNLEIVRHELGLDKPFHLQLLSYLQGLIRGDMGSSFFSNQPVTKMLLARIPVTLILAVISMIIALAIAIPMGILAAVKRGSFWDQAFMLLALFGVSMPSFWLALVLMLVFSVKLGWFPVVGTYFSTPGDWVRNFTLPALAIGFAQSALIARMTRASLLEVLRQDYVALTARAKGLPSWKVILKHALPNAAFPIVTVIGMGFSYLIGGVVIIETVFALPGVGSMLINSVSRRDYHVIQGVLLFIAALNVIMNLMVDISYTMIDKRVKYS